MVCMVCGGASQKVSLQGAVVLASSSNSDVTQMTHTAGTCSTALPSDFPDVRPSCCRAVVVMQPSGAVAGGIGR
jgi:hypothetical protein